MAGMGMSGGYTPRSGQTSGMLPYGAGSEDMYGPQEVPQSMLDILNMRFGWNPSGIAVGRQVKPIRAYYTPPQVFPNASVPPLV